MLFNLLLLLGVLIACAIALSSLLPIVLDHFRGRSGGWRVLASAYATAERPLGEIWRGQSVVAGLILYRYCVTVGIDKAGLYLAIVTPLAMLRQTPLLIPWSAFKQVEPRRDCFGAKLPSFPWAPRRSARSPSRRRSIDACCPISRPLSLRWRRRSELRGTPSEIDSRRTGSSRPLVLLKYLFSIAVPTLYFSRF